MNDPLVEAEVVRFCAELIRIDTTNRGGGDGAERPAAEYVAARLAEAGLEPVILESAPGRANVVARIAGTEPHRPALLVHGHLDVVPADPADWRVPPTSGEVVDGVLWGRGAVDMKNTDAMILALVRSWARQGRRPRRDVVLAFTADEEDTAAYGAQFLVDRHAGLFEGCTEAIGESGGYAVHTGRSRVYPVGAAERGTAWLRLTARGRAGHGSRANPDNAVAKLAAAVTRIAGHEWPVRLIPTVRACLAGLTGRRADELAEADAAGLSAALGAAGVLVASTLRNSANPTMLEAGDKVNVVPGIAIGYVDGRVLPGHLAEFEATLDTLTGPDVTWEYVHSEVPLEAPLASPTVADMAAALRAEDPAARVVPYCMAGGTDAKQFARLGIAGYGFAPLGLPAGYDYHAMFHGVDERVPVEALSFGVRVLDRFLTGRFAT
ncbi:acetylornithine deacetylase/succinyl-diaminopimelate desuccinylase-like protein [Krasilnikovia cinnamomea]|uniref:Acetylornithine deacetylase/succinyl-diaminopimelate desuccinylase-like protein n=1 Tax=Krasilnikovia cinnamomea TaxID=349313 RepID=A0A4Q7ZSA7_9ACTN|nr:M20/M25/M40 family metallo-hydrolase [Krasilnikovia cinnamomea]RZU53734.1 acetylornithine deacetylase/succinyl-diaminopimelate desuccinylase-like protein [Krasilnikovia cinnamomea]